MYIYNLSNTLKLIKEIKELSNIPNSSSFIENSNNNINSNSNRNTTNNTVNIYPFDIDRDLLKISTSAISNSNQVNDSQYSNDNFYTYYTNYIYDLYSSFMNNINNLIFTCFNTQQQD
ncbi:hypothetical protein B5S32_g4283 [[Candida] boidinii]|nr:hypothetical protein B5S32_g4283 [[Candida] boidinii]